MPSREELAALSDEDLAGLAADGWEAVLAPLLGSDPLTLELITRARLLPAERRCTILAMILVGLVGDDTAFYAWLDRIGDGLSPAELTGLERTALHCLQRAS